MIFRKISDTHASTLVILILACCATCTSNGDNHTWEESAVFQGSHKDLLPVIRPALGKMNPVAQDAIKNTWLELLANRNREEHIQAEAYGEYAEVLHAFDLFNLAENAYRNAIRLAPQTFRWHFYLAKLVERTGDPNQVKDAYANAIERKPKDIPTRLHHAEYLLKNGDIDQAETHFKHILTIQPDHWRGAFGIAKCDLARGNARKAVTTLENLTQEFPRERAILHQLGLAYRDLGMVDKAKPLIHGNASPTVFTNDPLMSALSKRNPEPYHRRAGRRLLDTRQFAEAESAFAKLVEIAPDDMSYRMGLAQAELGQGKRLLAARTCRSILLRDSDHPRANGMLGLILLTDNDPRGALPYLERAVQNDPNHGDTIFNLAKAHGRLRMYEEASQAAKQALSTDKAKANYHYWAGYYLARSNKIAESIDVLNDAALIFPEDEKVRLLLARLLAASSDAAVRDGIRATLLAEQPVEDALRWTRAVTLSMAAAETGNFVRAQSELEAAINGIKNPVYQSVFRRQLGEYKNGRPCRNPFLFEDAR